MTAEGINSGWIKSKENPPFTKDLSGSGSFSSCGGRLSHFSEVHLSLAWKLWIEERPQELIADILYDEAICSEIIRFIHVGLLCVQQKPENRPNMSSVVYMLKGEKSLPKPSEPGFYAGKDNTNNTGSSSQVLSINEGSISLLEGR